MQTSTGIFRGQEDINQSDDFPKANNSPPIVALEICRERMVIFITLKKKKKRNLMRYNGTMLSNSFSEYSDFYRIESKLYHTTIITLYFKNLSRIKALLYYICIPITNQNE